MSNRAQTPRFNKASTRSATSYDLAVQQVNDLPPISHVSSYEEKKKLLDALWAMSDAAIVNGLETWTHEQIADEIVRRRGSDR
jgi:hypothetical protein